MTTTQLYELYRGVMITAKIQASLTDGRENFFCKGGFHWKADSGSGGAPPGTDKEVILQIVKCP